MWLQVVSRPQRYLYCGNGLSRALAVASGFDWLQISSCRSSAQCSDHFYKMRYTPQTPQAVLGACALTSGFVKAGESSSSASAMLMGAQRAMSSAAARASRTSAQSTQRSTLVSARGSPTRLHLKRHSSMRCSGASGLHNQISVYISAAETIALMVAFK